MAVWHKRHRYPDSFSSEYLQASDGRLVEQQEFLVSEVGTDQGVSTQLGDADISNAPSRRIRLKER